jgi:hypothetical protein
MAQKNWKYRDEQEYKNASKKIKFVDWQKNKKYRIESKNFNDLKIYTIYKMNIQIIKFNMPKSQETIFTQITILLMNSTLSVKMFA